MTGEITIQLFILILSAFFLFKSILKLPKKIAITLLISFGLLITIIILISIYWPEVLIDLAIVSGSE